MPHRFLAAVRFAVCNNVLARLAPAPAI